MNRFLNKIFNKKSIPFIFSFIGTTGILQIYSIYSNNNIFNSFVNIILFSGLVSLYNKGFEKKQYKYFSTVFSIIVSLIIVLGTHLEIYSDIRWGIQLLYTIVALPFAFYPIFKIISNFKFKFNANTKNTKFIKIFITLLILNTISYLAMYPGIYHYDAAYQIIETIKPNIQITSHFSYVYCFVIGKIVNLGHVLFNSYTIGFGIFIFLQCIFMTYIYTKIIKFINERINSKTINYLLIILFGIFPLCTVMTMSATQDTLFAAFFGIIIIYLYKFIEDDTFINHTINIIKFVIFVLFLCMLRNNGFYAFLFSMPFVIVLMKNKRVRIIIAFITPLALYMCYSKILLPNIGVVNVDSIREMSSVPTQQFARVYTYDKLTNNNIANLEKFYDLNTFYYYQYNQSISDAMKAGLKTKYTEDHIKEYAKLWIYLGVRHPVNYIEAFLINTLGYWYPNKNYHDPRAYHNYEYYDMLDAKSYNKNYLDIKRHSIIKPYNNLLHNIIEKNNWKYIPIINTLFTIGFYFIVFLYTLIISLINKHYKLLVPYSLIIGLYITLLLSPVAIFRYFFPIFIVSPIYLSDIFMNKKKSINIIY